MYTFAGTLTLKGNPKVDLDVDYVEIFKKGGDKVIYILGETNLKSEEELIVMLKENIGEIISSDISFSRSNKVQIMNELFDDGVFEQATFEGEDVHFKEIIDRFMDSSEVITIREVEFSPIFKNRKVRVDFLY